MTNDDIRAVSQKFGTPSFIFDIPKLHRRMRAIAKITGSNIKLCYSIKANPFLIPAMLEVCDMLEVCSPGELSICRTLNVDAHRIVYSGVNKTSVDINDAFDYGVGIFTAESLLHISLINEAACTRSIRVPVLLRLTSGNQFGMSESDVLSIIKNRADYRGVEIKGIHYFAGTQRKKTQQQREDLKRLDALYQKIKDEYGFSLEQLEYGPGLAVPYFEGENFENSLAPLEELQDDLHRVAHRTELTIEMGRFFVSECGYYITSVMDTKSNEEMNFCIMDGGINHLNYYGQMMGMKIPVIQLIKKTESASVYSMSTGGRYSLFGSLCTTADVIAKNVRLPPLERGDVLAFENIGAYSVTEGIALFLSRTMPRIILYHGENDMRLARDFIESSTFNTIAKAAR